MAASAVVMLLHYLHKDPEDPESHVQRQSEHSPNDVPESLMGIMELPSTRLLKRTF